MGCISASMARLAVTVWLIVISCDVASLALQISTALCNVISPSLSSMPRVLSHVMSYIFNLDKAVM